MKTIGMIGGMSWESSSEYYRIINEEIKRRLGGLHSAKCILYSVDFDEIEKCQSENRWDEAGQILGDAAFSLEKAGAGFILICTNTMHKVIDQISQKISIPILHIADETAIQIKKHGMKKIGLLGTKYTMEHDFYKLRIESQDIEVLIPDEEERDVINKTIFNELCFGNIQESSRDCFKRIIGNLVSEGAEGIILGCTEIGLLIKQEDASVPLFDTTVIHAHGAVEKALNIK
ncbi:aspartate/glutamate racemase family protein [Mesobacillus boroniphilus]|uniref:Aspartate/glutamate racemase family protein n=1 Tax=Mesobacillus boroniphilus TaxID=308892 RepID=A0A944GXB8_9BACI|nr:aspartate/glutamate racemase family protein [Mesobacillus boroniphilus]MBS8264261.1 aspartate/glutamate racemase family protein [Mesobacillus boroniphilus]